MEMKTLNYIPEIDFLEIPQKNLGVLRGAFSGFECPKRHPDALLAKTMIPPTPFYQYCSPIDPETPVTLQKTHHFDNIFLMKITICKKKKYHKGQNVKLNTKKYIFLNHA